MNQEELSDIQHVREKPGMYIGTTGFFGLIHYFVGAVNLLLEQSPNQVSLEILDGGFRLRADIPIEVEYIDSEAFFPFERFTPERGGFAFYGTILNALSSKLNVTTGRQGRKCRFHFERGCRIDVSERPGDPTETVLEFVPDDTVFTVQNLSSYNFHSYFRRISFLNPTVEFLLKDKGKTHSYSSPNGIRGLFDGFAMPYQILHEPIHFRHVEGDLDLEVVWGFHSWRNDISLSFVNRGRAVEGGTHETGLVEALNSLREVVDQDGPKSNGVVVVMSMLYPKAVWEGCIKARVGNPELESLLSKIVVERSLEWIDARQGIREQMKELSVFPFPEIWST